MVAEDVLPVRKPSTSMDETEEVAASPASSVLSTEQTPVPGKPATVSSRSARGTCRPWLSISFNPCWCAFKQQNIFLLHLAMAVYFVLSLPLCSRMVVGQCTQPQVHARLHDLVTPPSVRRSSFQSTSQHGPRSLVEGGHVLLCHDLAGIARKYWHVEIVCFIACDQVNVVVDLVLCKSCKRVNKMLHLCTD